MSKEEEELFAQLQLREGTDIELKDEKDEEIPTDQSKGQQAYSEFVEEMAEHTPQRRQIRPEMSVIVTLDMVGVKHEL